MSEGRIGGESWTNGMEEFDWLDVGEARYSLSLCLCRKAPSVENFFFVFFRGWVPRGHGSHVVSEQSIWNVQKCVGRFRLKSSPSYFSLQIYAVQNRNGRPRCTEWALRRIHPTPKNFLWVGYPFLCGSCLKFHTNNPSRSANIKLHSV